MRRWDNYRFLRWIGRRGVVATSVSSFIPERAYQIQEGQRMPDTANFRNCSVLAERGARDVSVYRHDSGGLALEFHGPQHNSKDQLLVIDHDHVRKFIVSCLEVLADDLWDES